MSPRRTFVVGPASSRRSHDVAAPASQQSGLRTNSSPARDIAWARMAWIAFCAGATLACSSGREPEALPSQTVSQVTPQLEPPPPLPPPAPAIREVQPLNDRSTVKVIDEGGAAAQPKSLAEASQLAKALKGNHGPSVATINDDNLHEYSQKGDVIVLESAPAAPNPGNDVEALVDPTQSRVDSTVRDEQYWRNRALELRMGWRRTVDRIQELSLESAALRQRFYAEDDPYVRDGQLKPAWDRVLDRIEQLKTRSTQYERELETFIEEGRQSQAHQGWLNQGWELEPSATEMPWKADRPNDPDDNRLSTLESGEADVTDEVYDP